MSCAPMRLHHGDGRKRCFSRVVKKESFGEQPRLSRRGQHRHLDRAVLLRLAARPPSGRTGTKPMKKGYWIAAGLAVVFVLLGVTSFTKTLTPYLTFDEAKKARGVVQVMGSLDKTSDRYDTAREELSFDLLDASGRRMPVVYRGIRPGNFKDAISIVAIGRYREGRIQAEKLLVKCPSKYQWAEVERAYSSGPPPSKS